ncbi:MAG: BON domain-containing protein [Pseudomonadota bacterium]
MIVPALLAGCGPLLVAGLGTGVITAVQERSTGEALTDVEIKLQINRLLLDADSTLFTNVSTNVNEGRVVLLGNVPTRDDAIRAENITWSVADVREVTNQLTNGENGSAGSYLTDTRISNQVRARLITDDGIRFVNYGIETVNGTVHLMGLAQDAAELTRAVELARTVPGVTEVVSHVLLKDDPRRRRDNSTTRTAAAG